jgi:hypothetical protein
VDDVEILHAQLYGRGVRIPAAVWG